MLLLFPGPGAILLVVAGRLLASAVVNLDRLTDQPGWSILEAALITCAYLLAAELMRRSGVESRRFGEGGLRELGAFVLFGGVVAPVLAAVAVTAVWSVTDTLVGTGGWEAIRVLRIGDAVAVLTITPAVLGALRWWRVDRAQVLVRHEVGPGRRDRVQIACETLALILVPVLLVRSDDGGVNPALALMVLPPLWVASRGEMPGTSIAILVSTTALTVAARYRLGRSAELVELQAVILSAALAGHFTGAAIRTTRRQARTLAELQRRRDDALRRQARTDPLTELPNRTGLIEEIDALLDRRERSPGPVAAIVVGLDRFSLVTDGLGTAVGDEVLKHVAERIGQTLRPGDVLGRAGGDRFVAVLADVNGVEDASRAAERVLAAVRRPIHLDDRTLALVASAGLAMAPEDRRAGGELLADAEVALAMAKEAGGDRCVLYDPQDRVAVAALAQRLTDLRLGLDREELEVHYQPIIDLRSGHMVGAEALVRWYRPDVGMIPAGDMVGLAERTGLIAQLDDLVLRQVADQLSRWASLLGDRPFRVNVNLSPTELADERLVERIVQPLRTAGVETGRLAIEITETAAMREPTVTREALDGLRAEGVGVVLDDFGTGSSALGWLSRFPIDVLKIDRSFVEPLPGTTHDLMLVRSIVGLAHDLGLIVCAEGIETADQLTVLEELGCERGQGFRWSRAVPPDQFAALLGNLDDPVEPLDLRA